MKAVLIFITTLLLSVNSFAQDIAFSKQVLQAELEKNMPVIEQQGLFSITLNKPELDLLADQQRLSVRSHVIVKTAFGTENHGHIKVNGKLRYQAEDHSFYVDDPRLVEFNFNDLPPSLQPQVQALLEDIIADAVVKRPVYTLSDKNFEENMAKMMLKSILIKENAVVASLGFF